MRPLHHWPPLAHLALIAGFGMTVEWGRASPTVLVLPALETTVPAAPAIGEPLARAPEPQDYADWIEQIADRPLFAAGRRPGSVPGPTRAEAAVGAAPLAPPVEILIKGTIVDAGDGRALVELSGQAGEFWVSQGDSIADWTVREILAGAMRLSRGEESRMIHMFE